ncbi:MAG: hypothetical protein IPK64_14530 [bacterium]|nr:hypothetical protein [bacterium]
MRRPHLALLLLIALLGSTGCVQLRLDLDLDAKGGGTARIVMAADPQVLSARAELDRLGGQALGPALPAFDVITRPYLQKRGAGHGVALVTFNKGSADGRSTLDCTLRFTDLKGVSWMLNDVAAALGGAGLGYARGEGDHLVLRSKQYGFPAAAAPPAPPATGESARRQAELATTLIGAIGELDVSLNVTVPGDVVRSNAPQVAGRTSTWIINAGNLMSQQDVNPEIVFSGAGLAIKP